MGAIQERCLGRWGAPYSISGPAPHGVVWRYDGKTWTSAMPDTVDLLRHVHGTDSGDVWVVGLRGQMLRFHNGQWIPYDGCAGTALL